MDFLPADIQQYVETTTQPESDLLKKIDRDTHLHVLKPRMISGHLQGRVLSMLSHMIKPKRILEIGTYTGYATICLAEGLDDGGKIITLEVNEELKERTLGYFKEAGLEEKVEMRIGRAVEIIPQLSEKWDLVFIDADKENYHAYYDQVIDQMETGGYIIADNVLWSGKITDQSVKDKKTEKLRLFNQYVHEDQRVEHVLMPIRDGLMVARKL
ncbi:MAG: O-methyltransferase [Cyclobacteriaceae bacterium]